MPSAPTPLMATPRQTLRHEGPVQAVRVDLVTFDHLGLSLPLGVEAVERVEHEIGGIARRPRSGDHRVEDAEICFEQMAAQGRNRNSN
jgi:hypothetical protein